MKLINSSGFITPALKSSKTATSGGDSTETTHGT